ncbi:MarR family winged helix-turn-helix transcriptional regulator [Pelagibacterium sp.]|uniref:MarR family winged helix-turn-helix transcriptional regulator n=1 Tax=Pelagibacterium sp. TaxID=1967288 RepID=UPI003BABDE8E
MSNSMSALRRLIRANLLFIDHQREINAALMNTFLGVATYCNDPDIKDPLSIKELAKRLDLAPSTVSRHLRYLGHWQRKGVPGMGLVETMRSPHDDRAKHVRLTPEGEALLVRLMRILD